MTNKVYIFASLRIWGDPDILEDVMDEKSALINVSKWFHLNIETAIKRKSIWKCRLQNGNLILQTTFLSWLSCVNCYIFFYSNPSEFVPEGLTSIQMIAWRWIGDKSLSEQIIANFTGAYMRPLGLNQWVEKTLQSLWWLWKLRYSGPWYYGCRQ